MKSISEQIRQIRRASSVVALGLSATSLMLLALPTVASAQFSGLFNTGVDNSYAKLALGSTDPHYQVVENGLSQAIVSVTNRAYPVSASAAYIWQDADGNPGSVTRTFRTTFTLLAGYDPLTAMLTGKWYADNLGLDIILNGIASGQIYNGDPSFVDFSLGTGFVVGVNTIDFVVKDLGAPGALAVTNLVGTAVATSTVPEPSTVLLLAAGLFGGTVVGDRRKRWMR